MPRKAWQMGQYYICQVAEVTCLTWMLMLGNTTREGAKEKKFCPTLCCSQMEVAYLFHPPPWIPNSNIRQ